jgi:acyl-CoA thioesterase FadM
MAEFNGFTYRTCVYIGDATPFGQAYFARYFEWQGRAREEFFRYLVPHAAAFFESFQIVTAEALVQYRAELLFSEQVAVEVRIAAITKATVSLRFIYRKVITGNIAAEGFQRLVFMDHADRIVPVPDDVQRAVLAYMNLQAL